MGINSIKNIIIIFFKNFSLNLKRERGFTMIEVLVGLAIFGVASAATATAVINASSNTNKTLTLAEQNNAMKTSLSQMQNEIGEANKLLDVDSYDSLSENPAAGTEITFIRTAKNESNQDTYIVQKFTYHDNTVTDENLRNTITRQVVSSSAPFTNDADAITQVDAADEKIILDKVIAPDSNKPLFGYYNSVDEKANAATADWQDNVTLVEVIIRRDEDGDANEFQAIEKSTFVYLRNLAQSTQNNQGIEC